MHVDAFAVAGSAVCSVSYLFLFLLTTRDERYSRHFNYEAEQTLLSATVQNWLVLFDRLSDGKPAVNICHLQVALGLFKGNYSPSENMYF